MSRTVSAPETGDNLDEVTCSPNGEEETGDILRRVGEVRRMIAEAFSGKPIPDAYDLINGGRDDID